MEKNSHYLFVGIFVSIAFFALIIFVIWLAGTHDGRNYNRYTVYFHDAVNGLQESAVVQYRGIEVGRVKDVRLSANRSDLIKVDIEIDENTPITAQSEASLATLGITGLVFINLTTPEDGEKTPPQIVEGEKYPVIQGKGTQLSKLFQDIPEISKKILDIANKLDSVLNEENVSNLQGTIKNINEVSGQLNALMSDKNVENINTSLQNVTNASAEIENIVKKFDQTAGKIEQATDSINDVINRNKGNIDRFAGDGLNQITEMTRETKDMARAMRRLADKLEQNPSQILYKPNYSGVEIEK